MKKSNKNDIWWKLFHHTESQLITVLVWGIALYFGVLIIKILTT